MCEVGEVYLSVVLHACSNNRVDLELALIYGRHCDVRNLIAVLDGFEDVRW